MKTDLRDLTKGPLAKQIFWFSLPLICSHILQVLFNMADVAVVGRFAGSMALGAVGSTTTLVTLFTDFLIGLSGGVNVLSALYYGARDRKNLSATVHSAFLLCALAGLALLALGAAFARPILELLHTKEELLPGAALYLRIYFLGMPAMAVFNFGSAVFSAVGDTKRPLAYLLAAGAVNVALNLFFVTVCGMDVAGVAIASVISQYISAALVTAALFHCGEEAYGLRRADLRLHRAQAKSILRLGVPAGVQNCIFCVANLFVQVGVNTFDAVMVAGNSAAANADGLVYGVMDAVYIACGSFIGQNYGAREKERVKRSYLLSVTFSAGFGMAFGLLLAALGPQFLSLFTKDPAVIDAGMKRLTIMGFSYGISAFMDCTIAASRGLGRTLVPTVIVILGSCVFRIAWVYTVFAYFRTIPSLYLLYICSWTISAIAEIAYFLRICRRQLAEL